MFNFGDGAVAGLLVGDAERNEVLGSHAITNGAYSLQVKIAGGGSVDPDGYRFLEVQDPAEMKGGLDQESLPNFVAAARGARRALGAHARRPRLRLPAAHEALDVRGVAVASSECAKIRPCTSTTPAT